MSRKIASHYARKLQLDIESGAIQYSVDVKLRLHKSNVQYLNQINQIISELKAEGFIWEVIKTEAMKASRLN